MSTTDEEAGTSVEVTPALTFKQRLAQRRKELEADATFELEVNGYPGLWARYRILGYEEIRDIGIRIEGEVTSQSAGERLTAATTLAEACLELLELKGYDDKGKPILEGMGFKWTAMAARELFDVELPDGVVARDAIMAIFPYPRDMLMMQHFENYLEQGMGYIPEIERVLQGESRAASAATTWDSSPQQQ
jgi:hypothetical protein